MTQIRDSNRFWGKKKSSKFFDFLSWLDSYSSIYLYILPSTYISFHLPIYSIYPYILPSTYISIYPSIYLYILPSIHLSFLYKFLAFLDVCCPIKEMSANSPLANRNAPKNILGWITWMEYKHLIRQLPVR